MLPVMEWCIEDTEKGLLMLIKEDEPIINPEDGIYIVIFSSAEDAEDFMKEFDFDFSTGVICQKIIFGPKMSSDDARELLRKENENVKSTY